MQEDKKYTIKDLLAKHSITYIELYEFCEEEHTEYIQALYRRNVCTKEALQNIVNFINKQAGTCYTPAEVYVERLI